jgi:asparagine synthase (glutamine-hydrolysing)
MRRLAIIDLQCGDQPIYNEDRSIAVVCNGELYNYVEAFPVLEARGHRMQSGSDINLIPHFYEELKEGAFCELRGMFAGAVWDENARTLVLARDRAGKKPLFYCVTSWGIAFASELPALLGMLDHSPGLSNDAIAAYLSLGFIPHPLTIYEGVSALPPGHTLTYREGEGIEVKPYWSIPERVPFEGTRTEAIELLDNRLRESVALRLRSDVPVGLFLSGGIDSGLVASYAAEAGARDLLCFVVETDDAALNEAPAAHSVARKLGLPIETIPLHMAPLDAIEKVSLLFGQPFADSSAVPSFFVSRAAAQHRKVVLNGDGGDEIFAGYRRYWLARYSGIASHLPAAGLFRNVGNALGRRSRRSGIGFASRALRAAGLSEWEKYLTWTMDMLSPHDVARIFPELASRKKNYLVAERERNISTDGVDAFTKSDFGLILADDLLTKMDIATMANSLEARSPFLDIPLAEFAWSLPEEWRLNHRQTKPLLRELAGKRLPPEITSAPKRGFEVPVAKWLASDLRELLRDTLLASSSKVGALGDPKKLAAFVRGTDSFAGNRSQTIWTLLMLELFLRAPRPAPFSATT